MMRNALICAGAMLAMLLLWPFVFGTTGGSAANASQTAHVASTATMAIPEPAVVRPAIPPRTVSPGPGSAVESCFRRYQRTFNACAHGGIDACRHRAIDGWDICEVTGFWPD